MICSKINCLNSSSISQTCVWWILLFLLFSNAFEIYRRHWFNSSSSLHDNCLLFLSFTSICGNFKCRFEIEFLLLSSWYGNGNLWLFILFALNILFTVDFFWMYKLNLSLLFDLVWTALCISVPNFADNNLLRNFLTFTKVLNSTCSPLTKFLKQLRFFLV